MAAINSPIQGLWIGTELSIMECMCIESYLRNGHQFHLYTYDPVFNVPEGAVIRDANEIIPRSEITIDPFGGFVNFSNMFRYKLLYKLGGWWVDMDTVCLKPFDFEEDFVFSSETSDPYNRFLVNTTYIKALPQSKFLMDCIEFLDKRGYANIHWGELGVNLISRMIFQNGLQQYIKPPEYFCPVSGYQLNLLVEDNQYNFPANTYALHFWNELWRRKKLDKSKQYPYHSLYEVLKRKFNMDSIFVKRDDILDSEGSKIPLTDVTFVIPVSINSQEQLDNLQLLIKLINRDFETSIFLVEVDRSQKVNTEHLPANVQYQFIYCEDEIPDKIKYVQNIALEINTPIIGLWNSNVIVPGSQIINAINKIRYFNAKICCPFDGRSLQIDDILGYQFKKTMNISMLQDNMTNMRTLPAIYADNSAILFSKEILKSVNVNLQGFSETNNQLKRFTDLFSFQPIHIQGPSFHLWQPKDRDISSIKKWAINS